MQQIRRVARLGLFLVATLSAATEHPLPLALRGVDPDKLSSATFAALEAQGAFGPGATPSRAAAVYPDRSKGRPGAVLDPRVGVNVRLGDDPDPLPPTLRGQAEPHLYRSATNPDLLLACFQEGRHPDGGAVSCGYALSHDGGLTWTRSLVPRLSVAGGGTFLRATDPVAAIGPQGELYLNNLGSVDNAFGLAAVVVSRSTDNGATWTNPMIVFQSTTTQIFPDKNWFVVNDLPGAPNSGRLVVTWTNFTSNANGQSTGNNIIAAVSDDRGATWTPPIAITPAGSTNQGSQPLFLPDGSLGVVYITFLGSTLQFGINYKRSADGGRTYPATGNTVVGFVSGWDDPEMRDSIFLPSAAVARATGELFVTYTMNAGGTPRIMLTKSSDQGATWTPPVAVSDNPEGISVMNPTVAVTPDGRTVAVMFMDKRLAPGGRGFVDYFAALSFDGGATWQPNVRLSDLSSDLRFGPPTTRGVMLGDYFGLAPALATDQPFVAVWCDTRTGDSDPFTVRFAATESRSFDAWAVAQFPRAQLVDANVSRPEADPDRDGYPNAIECALGTNPHVAESGETFFLQQSAAGSIDVAWVERTTPTGFPVTTAVNFPDSGIVGTNPPSVALSANELPSMTTGENMHWVGARFTAPAHAGYVVGHALRFSLGIPPFVYGERATAGTDARLINVSTRGQVRGETAPLIVGFVIDGNKTMLVRGAGPALSALGVTNAVADPRLRLEALASDLELANDNWQQATSVMQIAPTPALFARLGAFPFPADSLDAALALRIGPQAYTSILTSTSNTAAVALVEAYDADATPGAIGNPRLLNLSTRGDAGTGENALVAGFVLGGTQPRRVLIRAIGPSLAGFGVTGTLADPLLTLHRGGAQVAQNDDWEISRSSAAIAATAQRVGAFPLERASLDAALLITLPPGAYTAVITGVGGTTGVALVEVYDAD